MSLCTERGSHAVGFGLAYGAHEGVQYVRCLECDEELRLQWDADDVAMFLRTSPVANEKEES